MSFRKNNIDNLSIFDSFNSLTPRNQRIVTRSWAKDFAEIVFPYINEERFSVSTAQVRIQDLICQLISSLVLLFLRSLLV